MLTRLALRALPFALLLGTAHAQSSPGLNFSSPKAPSAEFGASIAVDGDLAVVGAPGESAAVVQAGAAYVFELNASGWAQTARLDPGSGTFRKFGQRVAIEGQRIAVGGLEDQVKVFDRSGGAWMETGAALAPLPPVGLTGFGDALALEGDTLVVGERLNDTLAGTNGGAAYVYDFTGGQWTLTTTLIGSNSVAGGQFGWSIDLDGDDLAIGAPFQGGGRVYMFQRSGGVWTEVDRVSKADIPSGTITVPNGGDFGHSVALDGIDLAVGCPNEALNTSAVYTFSKGAGVWSWTDRLKGPGGSSNSGQSLDQFGDLLVVGDPKTFGGKAHIYQRVSSAGAEDWTLRETIASNLKAVSELGQAVAFAGGSVLVGAPETSSGELSSMYALARDEVNGILYASDRSSLFRIAGAYNVTEIGATGYGDIEAMAFDSQAGVLYAVDPVAGELLTLDPGTGAATSVGQLSLANNIRGLAWDSVAGVLYGLDLKLDHLVSIDVATAAVTRIGLPGAVGFTGIQSLTFDPVSNTLLGVDRMTEDLVAIDTTSGAGTSLGVFDAFGVRGLAFDPSGNTVTAVTSFSHYALDPVALTTTDLGPFGGRTGAFIEHALELDTAYCNAGTSALGCTALLATAGQASASDPAGFTVTATGAPGSTQGLFYFGANGRQATPWGNSSSLQCVAPPTRRAGLQLSSGAGGTCAGVFSEDLNAYWCGSCPKPGANPGAGVFVQAQLWYRDPLSTSNVTTSLSDAVEFLVLP